MNTGQLHLLLAPKERFEPGGAGAFALNALESSLASRWRERITVFGSPVANPFTAVRFQPIKTGRWSLRGRNTGMAKAYARLVKFAHPNLIEIFNRPIMVSTLRRNLGAVPIFLHFGNDPRGMTGSRSPAERRNLLRSATAIICVSDFIRRCFLEGMADASAESVTVMHTGVAAPSDIPLERDRRIVFVGRIVPEKGVLELVRALARILPRHPDWSAEIIGARWFGTGGKRDRYEIAVMKAAASCDRIMIGGFRTHETVLASLTAANIAVVPSKWDDPFPRTALEALAAGCALVCSRRGGLPEIGDNRALFLEEVSVETLERAIETLISDDSMRSALQHRARTDFPFAIARTTRSLDDLRDRFARMGPG